jgi:NNP family nitrate/nitrite transporter-like MFS transporter
MSIMSATQSKTAVDSNAHQPDRSLLMLGLATIGFAVNFWAWALISPLAIRFKGQLGLTGFQQALVVAVPVIVGSLGRIPIGALTDRYGGRVMFPVVSLSAVVPVLYLGLSGHASLAGLLIGGFFLGIGGTSFAVGVPFVNAWFPPARRGLAIGIFGMGMGGTAISALTTVKLVNAGGIERPFLICAAALVVYAVLAAVLLRDAPGRTPSAGTALSRVRQALSLRVTWQASALYAVGFGGYVAFSVYLPTYLKNAYALAQTDAANKMAGFVLLAVLMRPLGGWLSDRLRATTVLAAAFGVVAACAGVQSATPDLSPLGTIAFLVMAAALGAASGAVFALVAQLTAPDKVGSVTGVVGAAGGLGGFVPPLLMGSVYDSNGSYAIGLMLLSAVAAATLLFTMTAVRKLRTA